MAALGRFYYITKRTFSNVGAYSRLRSSYGFDMFYQSMVKIVLTGFELFWGSAVVQW